MIAVSAAEISLAISWLFSAVFIMLGNNCILLGWRQNTWKKPSRAVVLNLEKRRLKEDKTKDCSITSIMKRVCGPRGHALSQTRISFTLS